MILGFKTTGAFSAAAAIVQLLVFFSGIMNVSSSIFFLLTRHILPFKISLQAGKQKITSLFCCSFIIVRQLARVFVLHRLYVLDVGTPEAHPHSHKALYLPKSSY